MQNVTKQKYKELLEKSIELEKCKDLICKLQEQLNVKSSQIKQLRGQVSYCKHAHGKKIPMKESSCKQDNNIHEDIKVQKLVYF